MGADKVIPPPPPGFTLDVPPPPEGFVLDTPAPQASTQAIPPPPPGFVLDGPPMPQEEYGTMAQGPDAVFANEMASAGEVAGFPQIDTSIDVRRHHLPEGAAPLPADGPPSFKYARDLFVNLGRGIEGMAQTAVDAPEWLTGQSAAALTYINPLAGPEKREQARQTIMGPGGIGSINSLEVAKAVAEHYKGYITDPLKQAKEDPLGLIMDALWVGSLAPKVIRRAGAQIANTNWYRRMTIKERSLVAQSLEDVVRANPDMTEGEILRRFNSDRWRKEALAKRMAEPTPRQAAEPPVTPEPQSLPKSGEAPAPGSEVTATTAPPEAGATPGAPTAPARLSGSQGAAAEGRTPMPLDEWVKWAEGGKLHEATGTKVPGEEEALTPVGKGRANQYPEQDIAAFYLSRRTYLGENGEPDLLPKGKRTPEMAQMAYDEYHADLQAEAGATPGAPQIGLPGRKGLPYKHVPIGDSNKIKGKTFYHGTGRDYDIAAYDVYGKSAGKSLYGDGLYLTDNKAVARSYALKGTKNKEGFVHSVKMKDLNLVDLERPLPKDAANVLKDALREFGVSDNEIAETISKPGKEVYKKLTQVMADEGLTTTEAQETTTDIGHRLSALGYDGFSHFGKGGKAFGKDFGKHNVAILFEDLAVDHKTGKDVSRPLRDKFIPLDREAVSAEPAPPAKKDVDTRLREKVAAVEGDTLPPVGLSVQQITPAQAEMIRAKGGSPYRFKRDENEEAFQAAKGIPKEALRQQVLAKLVSIRNKLTREFEHLPRGAKFAPIRNELLRLQKQRGVSEGKAVQKIDGITAGLGNNYFELFRRKVVLDDMAAEHEVNPKAKLAFKYTPETLKEELSWLTPQAEATPPVAKALADREAVWEDLAKDYIAAMKGIGFKVDNLKKKNYFRRQVLEWQKLDRLLQSTGKRVRTPANRSYLKGRKSEKGLDYNTDYLQAEHQVMAQMLYDMEVARVLKKVRQHYDIAAKLKAEAKQEGIKDWKSLIPEDYVEWQPREGNTFYLADSIPARLAEEIAAGQIETLIGKELAKQLRKVLAVGKKRAAYVIPREIALTLDNFVRQRSDNPISQASRWSLLKWKQWVLQSPRRFFKYNLRNMTGDAEAVFVGNPHAFFKLPRATKELLDVYRGKRLPSKEMQLWYERGGTLSNLQAYEMGEIGKLEAFRRLMDKKEKAKQDINIWKKYWRLVRLATDFRESILRYAAFLDYMEQMKKSPTGRPKNFGASRPDEVMALPTIPDRAWWMSNELLGAYDRVSVVGQGLSDQLYGFWRWKEVNFKRYIQLFRNAANDNRIAAAVGRKVLGKAANPMTYIRIGRFVIMATAFWTAIQLYNNLFFPEEEKDLPADVRNRTHIVLGRDEDGKVNYFSRLGTLGDFLEWFGMDAAPQWFMAWANGKKSLKEIAEHIAMAPAKMFIQGATPFIKVPMEIVTRRSLFPDPFQPGTVRDRGLQVARSLGLESEYKAIFGLPGPPYKDTLSKIFIYKADPYESGYRDIMRTKREFLDKIGKSAEGFWLTPRSNALYYAKLAWRYGQKKEAAKYYREYRMLGGTDKGLVRAMKAMNPLYGLSKTERQVFIKSLTESEKEALLRALAFYNYTLLKGQSVPTKQTPEGR